jgi:DNA-binding CsgD family transcriptional regulator
MLPVARSALIDRLRDLPGIYGHLRTSTGAGDMFARASALVLRDGAFQRAVVLSVAHQRLTALDSEALEHTASDQLRRRVLSAPVALARGTEEAELVRRGDLAAARARTVATPSVLADELELGECAFGPVIVDARTLALLVVDREGPEIDDEERVWVDLFATVIGVALSDVVMRARVAEISAELRAFTTSATALVREASDGTTELPSNSGAGPSLARIGLDVASDDVASIFSERELRVAELLVSGKSNRQIAEDLVVSPETVKTHVARILRKLGAQNRAEAVGIFMRLKDR